MPEQHKKKLTGKQKTLQEKQLTKIGEQPELEGSVTVNMPVPQNNTTKPPESNEVNGKKV